MGFLARLMGPILAGAVLGGCLASMPRTPHPSEVLDDEGMRLYNEAQSRMSMGGFEQAESLLRQLVKRNPDYFRAWRALQEVLIQSRGAQAALAMMEREVESTRDARMLTLMARLQADSEDRRKVLEEALVQDETYIWAHYGLAYLIMNERWIAEYETAREHLEHALNHTATFEEAQRLLIELLHRLGDTEEEVRQLRIYVETYPEDLEARYNLADLLRGKLEDYEGALEQLKEILAREPARIDALLLKGLVLFQAEEFQAAEALYRNLSQVHPSAWLNLGLIYMNPLNDPQRALQCFQEYLDYTGQNAEDRTFWDLEILVPTYMDRIRRGES